MDKALEMGKSSATGSFHLLIGVVGATVLMAVGTLILAGMLSVPELGLYGMALIPSSIINYFRDWGVNSALTQQIAALKAKGKDAEIHDVIVSGVIFEILTGAVTALVCFAVAQPLAYILSPANAASLTTYIAIMSLSVFSGALLAAAAGIFVGFERMKLNSFTQILQAVVKTALGPLLIVLGFSVLGAIYAATISAVVGGVVAILLVYYSLFRPLRKDKVGKCAIKKTLKPMLGYGLPLTVSSIVAGVLPLVIVFAMAVYAGEDMMGNYYAGSYFAVLLTFISFPVATALFPVFSKVNPEKETQLMQTVFSSSVKYTALLLVPATMILVTLATPLVNTLFPKDGILNSMFTANAEPKFPYAPLFLSLVSIINLLVLVGNISLGTLQTGIGKTRQVMLQSVFSIAVGLPAAYGLVVFFYSLGGANAQAAASYAVIGGLIGIFIASIPGMAWGLYWLWKNYRVKADFLVSAKIFAASAIASLITYLLISFMVLPWVATLVIGFCVFALVYLTSAPLLGAVNEMDINNFKAMFSSLGIIAKLLDLPLGFMKRMCRETGIKVKEPLPPELSGEKP
jgi:stage V sporulation protein B